MLQQPARQIMGKNNSPTKNNADSESCFNTSQGSTTGKPSSDANNQIQAKLKSF